MARHPGAHSAEFYRSQAIVLATSDICHLCGHPGARQMDHIVPRRAGGGDHVSNLAPAHGHDDRRGQSGVDYRCFWCSPLGVACNQSRKTKPVPESYRSRNW